MILLIPTHNIYYLLSLVLLILGSFYISQIIQKYLGKYIKIIAIESQILTKLLILGYGIFAFNCHFIFSYNLRLILSCLIGLVLGAICYFFEKNIINFSLKYQKNRSTFIGKNEFDLQVNFNPKVLWLSCIYIGLIGILEELLYRGFLFSLIWGYIPKFLYLYIIIVINIFFALNHVSVSILQFVAKFFLGLFCSIAILLTGEILTALVTHAIFNVFAIFKNRELYVN